MNENSSDEEPTFQSVQSKPTIATLPERKRKDNISNDENLFSNLSLDSFEVYTTLGTGTFGRVK